MQQVNRLSDSFQELREGLRSRPGWMVSVPLAGLLIAIAVAGIVGLAVNRNIEMIANNALTRDQELEDIGDDLRIAVLEVRHQHREIAQFGSGSTEWQLAFNELRLQLSRYADQNVNEPSAPSVEEFRAVARDYSETFSPVLGQDIQSSTFQTASAQGFELLLDLERLAEDVDNLGNRRAEAAIATLDGANAQARVILLAVLGGMVLVGIALAWSAVRVVGEIRDLYEAQQLASAQLADALKAKTNFIADASHELRTPLTVLRGNAEAGLAIDPTWEHREILEEIVSESARMTRLVEDLLFLARSDAASVPFRIEAIVAEPFMTDLAERAKILVREHGASFMSALAGHGTISIDPVRIEQAVMVLIDNAAKYSPEKGRVNLNTSTWSDEFIIEVADQGPGVPDEELPLIFERFYRVDKARSRRLGGAGLGLSIAKTIVEAHGGRIEAQSRAGEGTKMRIHLPLTSLTSASGSPSPAELVRVA